MEKENRPTMSSNQGRKNQRPAERLSVVLDSGAGILTRLRDVATTTGNAERLKEMPWNKPRLRVVSATMRRRFPEYPNLTDVDRGEWSDLRGQAGGICQQLEPMYLVLHDSMELHTQVWKLLTELADDYMLPAYGDAPALVGGLLDLMVLFARISILLGEIADSDLLVCYYAWSYQYATGIAEASFTRLAKLIHACVDRDRALAYVRATCAELPVADAFRKAVRVSERIGRLVLGELGGGPFAPAGNRDPHSGTVLSRFTLLTSALEEDDLLGAPLRAEAIQYPAGYTVVVGRAPGEAPYYMLPSLSRMGTWLCYAFLVAPQLIHMHPRGVQGLCAACGAAWMDEGPGLELWFHAEMYKVFHDKDFIQAFTDEKDKTGFREGKAAFKESIANFMKNAAGAHRARRAYVLGRTLRTTSLLKDSPGLFGPQWHLVTATLALARDEMLWWIRHHIVGNPHLKDKVYTGSGQTWPADDNQAQAPALLAAAVALRDLAISHAAVASEYASDYLQGTISAQLEALLPTAAAALGAGSEGGDGGGSGGRIVSLLSGIQSNAELGGEGDNAAEGARLDVARLMLELHRADRITVPGGGGGAMAGGVGKQLLRIHAMSAVAEGPAGAEADVREAMSLHELWFRQKELHQVLDLTLVKRPRAAVSLVEVLDDFTRGAQLSMPGQVNERGTQAAASAAAMLQRISACVCSKVRAAAAQEGEAGSHRALAEICAAVRKGAPQGGTGPCGVIRVYTTQFDLIGWVMMTLKADVAAFVKERLWVNGGQRLAKPQGVVQALQAYMAALRVVEAQTGAPVDGLVEKALAELFESGQSDAIGKWFAAEIVKDKTIFVPLRSHFTAPYPELEHATSPAGLRALAGLIGPAGFRVVDQRLLSGAVAEVKAVFDYLTANKDALQRAKGEDRRRFAPEVVARLARLPEFAALTAAVTRLGAIQTLRQQLSEALGRALAPSLLPATFSAGAQGGGGGVAVGLAALACGCSAAVSWPADEVLRQAVTSEHGPLHSSKSAFWSVAAYGLGVFPLDVSLDAQRCVYDPQIQALTGNVLCAPRGLVTLALLVGDVSALADMTACCVCAVLCSVQGIATARTVSDGRVFFLERLAAEAGPFLPPASGGGLLRADEGSKDGPPGGALWSGVLVDSLPRMLHAARVADDDEHDHSEETEAD